MEVVEVKGVRRRSPLPSMSKGAGEEAPPPPAAAAAAAAGLLEAPVSAPFKGAGDRGAAISKRLEACFSLSISLSEGSID